jgi:type VI secretion system protein ImpL
MGKIIGKIFKIFLILLIIAALAALLAALAFWLVYFKGWPWWFAAALVAGLIGLWVLVLYLKKYLLRSREREFVQRVIDQDTAAIERAPVSRRHELLELQEHWKESVGRLQQSDLRKKGNPLYVLPWFLIMGESRVGKTAAVKNAHQSTPMSEISRSSGTSGTRNCDWWFFDQAILLDTTGRYTIPIDEGPDLEEWKQFLVLLSKYRKREPLNGVIAAISADKLLAADETQLREEGQSIRQRIDQMMRTIGAKFPIYVLITKMDLVHGFTEFNQHLPPGSAAQAMGYTNETFRLYWQDVMEEAVGSISRSLKNLRFLLVHHTQPPAPGTILFPNEFERMAKGMAMFLEAVFEENPYQETLMFRGLFFSSALRKGAPSSEFLTITGLNGELPAESDHDEGFFLKDFFAGILPKDRDLFTPLREFVVWRRLTKSLGLLSWLLLCLPVYGLLGFSFYHNYTTIKDFTTVFYDPPRLEKDRATNLLMLDKMRLEILDMENDNRSLFLPRFGLNQSTRVVDRLKQDYLKLFKEGFLGPLRDKLIRNVERVDKNTSEDEFADYAEYIVAQIGVLEAHLAGKRLPLGEEFREISTDLLVTEDRKLLPEIAQKFGSIYYAYVTWSKNVAYTEARLKEFRLALFNLVDKRGQDLRWLARKRIPGAPDLHLNNFWESTAIGDIQNKIVIPGAFTSQGRKHIEAFISYIEAALGIKKSTLASAKEKVKKDLTKRKKADTSGSSNDKEIPLKGKEKTFPLFEKRKKQFWIWYHQEFYLTWYAFIEQFREAEKRIETAAGWNRMATLMTTDENPYFQLLQRAADEITSFKTGKQAPEWSGMVQRLEEVRKLAKTQKEKKESVKAKLVAKTESLKKILEEKVDKQKARELEDKIKQAGAWNVYIQSLQKIQLSVLSKKQGYDIYAGEFSFSGQKSGEQSPFALAYSNYYKLKTMMTFRTSFPVIWDLVFGPQAFLLTLAAEQTACYLQEQWQEQVLSYLPGIDSDKISRLLFDKSEGVVWKFLENTAKPFIGRNERGYFARRDFHKNALPFSGELIHFLNQGTKGVIEYQPDYTVTFETLPLDVNDDAKVEPYAGNLQVNCSDKKFVLENYNYPKKASFAWSPDKCGDVSLTISFPDITLQRNYKGNMGFAKFLKDFRDGSHTFLSEEFSDQKDHLKIIGVSWIKLAYKITGGNRVIQLLERVPTKVPKKIVMCGFNEK